MQTPLSSNLPKNLQPFPLHRMMWTNDSDPLGQVLDVGSVSWVPSITSIMRC